MPGDRDHDRFKISLYENGVHSLKQGLGAYQSYRTNQDPIQLKDAIMGIHHGVELLLKEMLVHHNQFLIFENLRNVAKKQKQADRNDVGIFYIDHPPRTVGFREALDRVEAFLRPETLDDDLISLFEELNRYRNQLEHYAVDADLEEVARLVADIQDPLLRLLESELEDVGELREAEVEGVFNEARQVRQLGYEFLQKIQGLVKRFRRQELPGSLFNSDESIQLPEFQEVLAEYRVPHWPMQLIDLFARSENQAWAIEVKQALGRGRTGSNVVQNLRNIAGLADATPWLVIGTFASQHLRGICQDAGVLLSDADDIDGIAHHLDQPSLL